jgi:hypothetical protein
MKCALCNGKLIKRFGEIEFNSQSIGKALVPNLEFLECKECENKILTPKEFDKAIDFIANEEKRAIADLPIKDFITAKEAAKILEITKQAFSKHPRIKRGLIYSIQIDDRKYYDRKSVELFKEKGNGKYLLPKHGMQYIKPKEEPMLKFYSVIEPIPHEKHYGDFAIFTHQIRRKYTFDKILIAGRQ